MGKAAELATHAEIQEIETAAADLWRRMQTLVDRNPTYIGIEEPERSACVARLAQQALSSQVVAHVPGADQAYVVLSACGRAVAGAVWSFSPEMKMRALDLHAREVAVGLADHQVLLEPKGTA